ncbi:uncharacterized protein V1516DRAFT_613495, partial [Lipomyces oligophaga]|uniref:uncharacterized protein n=1 Tax=Lipomyces oligophaga TaxID=45792 RepID=UPI0034CD4E42
PCAIVSKTLAKSPVIRAILPFRLSGNAPAIAIVKEASVEVFHIRQTDINLIGSREHYLDLAARVPSFGRVKSASVIPYAVDPFAYQDDAEDVVDHMAASSSVSLDPAALSTLISSSGEDSRNPLSSTYQYRANMSRLSPHTLVLISVDQHLIFVTCADDDELIVVKNIKLRDVFGTIYYE